MEEVEGQVNAAGVSAKNVKRWLKIVVVFALMFGFGLLPPIYPLEKLGMQILGIFLGLLYAWTFVGFIWPSLLALVALGMTSYSTMNGVFLAGFGDQITVFVFLVTIFSTYLEDSGLMKKLAYWIISRKIAIGRPWLLTFLILLATYIMGAVTAVFAAIFLMWEIFYSICEVVGYKKGDKYPAFIVIGIVIAAMMGITALPFKAVPMMVFGALGKASGGAVSIDFLQFTIISVIISLCTLVAYFLLCRFVFRLDIEPLRRADTSQLVELGSPKFTGSEKIAFAALIAFITLLFAPNLLPKGSLLGAYIGKLGLLGALTSILVVYCVFSYKGEPIINFTKYASSKSMNWDMVIMFAGTMPVAAAMSSSDVGVVNLMMYYLEPILSNVSPVVMSVLIVLIAALMTQFIHNVVMAVIITPVMYQFAVATGVDPVPLAILIAFSLGVAVITPAASSTAALMYLNTQWVSTKRAYFAATTTVICALIIIFCIGWPLTKFVVH